VPYREDSTGWTGVVCEIIELVRDVSEVVRLCLAFVPVFPLKGFARTFFLECVQWFCC